MTDTDPYEVSRVAIAPGIGVPVSFTKATSSGLEQHSKRLFNTFCG